MTGKINLTYLTGKQSICCSLARDPWQQSDAVTRLLWHSRRHMLHEQQGKRSETDTMTC